ncbi:MAG: ribosome recycling factor [Parcubacteria group bacterium]|nr:ribosome recycling factor [Parcubacteria group bacterium]
MIQNYLDKIKSKFEKSVETFKSELLSLRVGRASPALIENLVVDAYDSKMKLQELASISAPDAKILEILPWDKNILKNIEEAIRKSPLGLNPNIAGDKIRLVLPPLTDERKKELFKLISRLAEEARQIIRKEREEILREIGRLSKDGEISEDEFFKFKENLQKLVDEFNAKIKDLQNKKEDEINK